MKRIAVVTCHKDPDYVRARTLRAGVAALPDVELIVIKNRLRSPLRFPEIWFRIIVARLRYRPQLYILTFRGYETLFPLLVLGWPTPVIFDEFVNAFAWFVDEHQKPFSKSWPSRLLQRFYDWQLRRCRALLTDTPGSAKTSSIKSGVPLSHYYPIVVSADESLFKPMSVKRSGDFRVFFYGNMIPLHGLPFVLDAAVLLKDAPIIFQVVGGGASTVKLIRETEVKGAHIEYSPWINFDKLPAAIAKADLCLGGPFGGTGQAKTVITGKTYQFLAMARPVLVGDNPETSRYFVDHKNGLVVDRADAKGLAASIGWAFKHPQELQKIGSNGRQLYTNEFSVDCVTKLLSEMLKQLQL